MKTIKYLLTSTLLIVCFMLYVSDAQSQPKKATEKQTKEVAAEKGKDAKEMQKREKKKA
jgi:hypothetical protein